MIMPIGFERGQSRHVQCLEDRLTKLEVGPSFDLKLILSLSRIPIALTTLAFIVSQKQNLELTSRCCELEDRSKGEIERMFTELQVRSCSIVSETPSRFTHCPLEDR